MRGAPCHLPGLALAFYPTLVEHAASPLTVVSTKAHAHSSVVQFIRSARTATVEFSAEVGGTDVVSEWELNHLDDK